MVLGSRGSGVLGSGSQLSLSLRDGCLYFPSELRLVHLQKSSRDLLPFSVTNDPPPFPNSPWGVNLRGRVKHPWSFGFWYRPCPCRCRRLYEVVLMAFLFSPRCGSSTCWLQLCICFIFGMARGDSCPSWCLCRAGVLAASLEEQALTE